MALALVLAELGHSDLKAGHKEWGSPVSGRPEFLGGCLSDTRLHPSLNSPCRQLWWSNGAGQPAPSLWQPL